MTKSWRCVATITHVCSFHRRINQLGLLVILKNYMCGFFLSFFLKGRGMDLNVRKYPWKPRMWWTFLGYWALISSHARFCVEKFSLKGLSVMTPIPKPYCSNAQFGDALCWYKCARQRLLLISNEAIVLFGLEEKVMAMFLIWENLITTKSPVGRKRHGNGR